MAATNNLGASRSQTLLGLNYKNSHNNNHHNNNNHNNQNNNNNNNHHHHHQQDQLNLSSNASSRLTNNNQNQNNQNQNSISNGQQQITGAPLDAPADCIIACDGGHLTAHKLLLCDHSKYLQDILSKHPTHDYPIIILTELNIMDIRILVNYMYTGELVITSDSSPTSLLRAAQILKIDSLTDDESHDGQPDGDERSLEGEHELEEDEQLDYELDEEQDEQQRLEHEEEDDEMDDDDDNNNSANNLTINSHHHLNINNNNSNHNTRLINSIRNIYNLQFMNQNINNNLNGSSPPQQLSNHHMSMGENTTASSKSDFGSNSITSNQHLDLEDLQDSRPGLDNKNNKIRCHLCNIGLSDVKCLYRHVLTRHLPEKWGYKCEFCDREFSRDDHLMRHYTTKHKNMEFNREKIRETRRLNREMAKNFHDQISTA